MCRYAMSGPYNEKYACFECRKVFKQRPIQKLARKMRVDDQGNRVVLCPECRTPMRNMGLDFHAPRQSDVRQWRKVALLYAHGFSYSSCGCGGPGYRPATLREAPGFIAEQKRLREEYERRRQKQMRKAERKK